MAGRRSPARATRDLVARVLEEGPEGDFVGGRDLTRWPTAAGRAAVRLAVRAGRWLTPDQVLALVLVVGLVLTSALAALTGAVYDAVVDAEGVAVLDRPVLAAAVAIRSPDLTALVTAYTDVGGTVGLPILVVVVALALSWARRRWTPLVLITVTMLGSLVMTVAGKAAVGRSRPPLSAAVPPFEESASFPSGHSLNSLVFAGIVAYLLVRRMHRAWTRAVTIALACAFAGTMGLTRVYLGRHWFTDVLVAWTLGLAWLSVVITAHRLYLTVHRRRHHADGAPDHRHAR
jgi:membrane-associated phospholipid phosphatase